MHTPIRFLLASQLAATALAQCVPDLMALPVSAPSIANIGQQIFVDYDVENLLSSFPCPLGTGPLFEDRFELMDVVTTNVRHLATPCRNFLSYSFQGLPAGWRYSQLVPPMNPAQQINLPLDIRDGDYVIRFLVNSSNSYDCAGQNRWPFPEVNFNNNLATAPIHINGLPDLVIENLACSPVPLPPGGTMQVTFDLVNTDGSVNNGSAFVDVYLSTTAAPGGTLLGRVPQAQVAAHSRLPQSIQCPVPAVPLGDYFVVTVADPTDAVAEWNQTNNVTAIPVTVAPPASVTLFEAGCPGTAGVPQISAIGLPRLGNASFKIRLDTLLPFGLASLFLGFDNTNSRYGPLPLQLPNAPGCALLVDPGTVWVGNPLGPTYLEFLHPIPNDPSLLDLRIYYQGADEDLSANALGVVFTQGLDAQIGR